MMRSSSIALLAATLFLGPGTTTAHATPVSAESGVTLRAAVTCTYGAPHGVNVRSRPTTASSVLHHYSSSDNIYGTCHYVTGQLVTRPCGYTDNSDQWAEIRVGGRIGYAVWGCITTLN